MHIYIHTCTHKHIAIYYSYYDCDTHIACNEKV